MDASVTAAELASLLASPAAGADLAAEPGTLVVVRGDVDRGVGDGRVAPLRVPPLWPVVVVRVDAGGDASAAAGCDLACTPDALDAVRATVAAHPQAATALVVLLRGAGARDVAAGLHAESAVYGVLQAGAEHAAWLAAHPPRRDVVAPGAPLTVERVGDVLRIELTRPDLRNPLDASLRDALADALLVAAEDPSLQVDLRGAGPCFCSGGYLDEFGARPDAATAHLVRLARNVGWLLHELADRTTVHVHGDVRGSGVELAAFAGRVVADPAATFALPEVGMGLIPGAGGTVSVTRRVGAPRTAWLALTGLPVDAPTAVAWGLADAIAPR